MVGLSPPQAARVMMISKATMQMSIREHSPLSFIERCIVVFSTMLEQPCLWGSFMLTFQACRCYALDNVPLQGDVNYQDRYCYDYRAREHKAVFGAIRTL